MRPLKVCVVDDDPDFAEGIALALETAGHQVELASNGEEALRILERLNFDVTLLDYRMPGMDGLDSYMQIRKIKPDAKVIMMTAFEKEDRLEQAIEAGVLGVLHKPISEDDLLRAFKLGQLSGNILLVDDDPDFTDAITIPLTDEGYSVLVAHTGREAVDAALERDFDIMLLDLRLPALNGLDVYVQLKEHNRGLPTVVVTGYATEEADAIDRLRQMSVSNCLTKPVRKDDLLQAVEQLFMEIQK